MALKVTKTVLKNQDFDFQAIIDGFAHASSVVLVTATADFPSVFLIFHGLDALYRNCFNLHT